MNRRTSQLNVGRLQRPPPQNARNRRKGTLTGNHKSGKRNAHIVRPLRRPLCFQVIRGLNIRVN
jgi:hypothetical protein